MAPLARSFAVAAAAALSLVTAAPTSGQQYAFGGGEAYRSILPNKGNNGRTFDPMDHMSGIASYRDAPGARLTPPKDCTVSAIALLMRHSCIYANSDEWADFMLPFAEKIESAQDEGAFDDLDDESPLAFLKAWQGKEVVSEEQVSQITEPGRRDAFGMGKRMRHLYAPLFPPKDVGKGKDKGKNIPTPFKVFTASSERDVETSKAFIKGVFPKWQEGEDGEGDGKYVSLVKVSNKDPDWAGSLTPHKICPAFSKEFGKPESRVWLETFGYAPLARITKLANSRVDFTLDDVIAMFMWCGYESVILDERKSEFCKEGIFLEHEFHAFGYWNDIKYWYQVGYGAKYSPHLGVGWLNSSTHNLIAAYAPPHPHLSGGSDNLPPPDAPPDTEHTQLFFPYFTHREEPPLVLTALGLWNGTAPDPFRIDHHRPWKTSRILPFLGHVALERMSCKGTEDQIRVIVNGAVQKMPHCRTGPGGSCPLGDFEQFVKERVAKYNDFEGVCKAEEEE